MEAVTVGVDVGQKRDPTALVVCEVCEERTGGIRHATTPWEGWHVCTANCRPETVTIYTVRFLERLPLGLSYPAIVDRVVEVVDRLRAKAPMAARWLFVDCTGVGAPVVDLLRQRITDPLIAVTLAAGERLNVRGHEARVGKAFLVSRLQVLLQNGQIRLPKAAEAAVLARELMDFELLVDQDGTDRYGAFRVGTHDDLVIALGLAVLYDPGRYRVEYAPSLWG